MLNVRERIALAILAHGLEEFVPLMTAEGQARRISGIAPPGSLDLALEVIRGLSDSGLVRVGELRQPDQAVIVGDIDGLCQETRRRYEESAVSGRDTWSWYLATENTPEGDAAVRGASEGLLRELFPGWSGWACD